MSYSMAQLLFISSQEKKYIQFSWLK